MCLRVLRGVFLFVLWAGSWRDLHVRARGDVRLFSVRTSPRVRRIISPSPYMRLISKHRSQKMQHLRITPLIFAIATIFCLVFAVSCQVPSDKFGYDNLSLGIPGSADTIINRPGYALGYSEPHEQAAWVIYRLTAEELRTKVASRSDDFRADPDVPTGSATPSDYKNSGFDRGHMATAADMAHSARTMSDSFFMSNICPQRPECNRRIWKTRSASLPLPNRMCILSLDRFS